MTAKAKTAVEVVQESQDLELLESLAELGSGATIQVYREPGREFLANVEPDAIELDHIREMFGGGTYSLRARRDGKWIKGVSLVRVRIAGSPKPGTPGQPLPGELAPVVVATLAPPSTLDERLARIELALAGGGAPESPTAAMMTMLTTLVVPVLTTALQRQPENSAVEILGLARSIAKDQRKAHEDRDRAGSDPVTTLGLPLLEVLQRGIAAPRQPNALPAAPVAIEVRDDVELEAANEVSSGPPTTHQLAASVFAWCEPLERRGGDPQMRAWCFLEDMEGSPLLDPVIELVSLPNVLDLWVTIAPRIGENRGWYAAFVDELRRLTAPDGDEDDPVGEPGHAGHVEGNGAAGPLGEPVAGSTEASA